MTRIYLLAEGQTEETFVRELLGPHLARMDIFITPIVLSTSRGHKGGVTSYGKVRGQIVRLCKQDAESFVTTMIDLYALPSDFPGKSDSAYPSRGGGAKKSEFLEKRLENDIGQRNFIPYIAAHEFEACLFVDPSQFAEWTMSTEVVKGLKAVADDYGNPEDINEGPATAPSKRILALMPAYEKTFHGPLIAAGVGLESIRAACSHFDAWLSRLERLAVREEAR